MTATTTKATTTEQRMHELQSVSRRLRTALALYESGIAMKRARLHRENPGANEQEIAARLAAWLRTRPGAPLGDAEGVARALPDSR